LNGLFVGAMVFQSPIAMGNVPSISPMRRGGPQ
jgi:hypothetical protein